MDSSFIIKYLYLSSLSWEHAPLRKIGFSLCYTTSDRICHLIGRYYYLGLLHWPGTCLAINQTSEAPISKLSYCESHQTFSQIAHRSCKVFILWDIQSMNGYGSEQPALVGTGLSRGVGLDDFQRSLSTSDILWVCDQFLSHVWHDAENVLFSLTPHMYSTQCTRDPDKKIQQYTMPVVPPQPDSAAGHLSTVIIQWRKPPSLGYTSEPTWWVLRLSLI